MRNFKIVPELICLLILSIVPFQKIARAESTAEQYEKYINQMIPLSYELANTTAGLKEHEVVLNLISSSQQELGALSVNLDKIRAQIASITSSAISGCRTSETGDFDRQSVLQDLYQYQEFKRELEDARTHLKNYQNISESTNTACNHGFEHIRFGASDFDILIPKIETMDGVFFSVGDPLQSIIDLVSSIFSVFSNHNERQSIQESSVRFSQMRAKDSDLQHAAVRACRMELESIGPAFQLFDAFALSAITQIKEIENLHLERVENLLLQCFRDQENRLVSEWIEQAARSIDTSQSDQIKLNIAQIRARQLALRIIANPTSKPCSVEELNRSESLVEWMQLLGTTEELVFNRLKELVGPCKESLR